MDHADGALPSLVAGKNGMTTSPSSSLSTEAYRRHSLPASRRSTLPKIPHYNEYIRRKSQKDVGPTPSMVKLLYTGQLPPEYFNQMCYGKRESPGEFHYKGPPVQRDYNLWEPKGDVGQHVRRLSLDLQAASNRHRKIMDKRSDKLKLKRSKAESILLVHAGTMSHGMTVALDRMDKEREKLIASGRVKQKQKAPVEATA